ncbi:MAG: acetylxylan esterase, partial [Clostridia bacterium]|nr:acetylxylan esterase [Clostridia bacterium]
YLPIEEIIDSGFAVFSVCYNDISTDNNDFTNGIARLFTKSERKGDDSSKISYWSYMAMRMMDYLKTREEAKNSIIGIGGHSRLGKTALLTGALDERFDFVCSNNSGSSGVALSRCRCEGGEYLRIGFNWFPYWYAPNYEAYVDCAEKLPFDQHALVALVAPRLLLVGAAEKDVWADNDNQFLACVAASPAWELYGKKGLISPDKMPKVGDNLNEGNICFHLREGEHFHSRFDWNVYMQSVKKHFNIK